MVTISEFIKALSATDKYISDIYMCGDCYRFAKFLCLVYPGAEIVVNMDYGHAMVKYNSTYYDIMGEHRDVEGYHSPTSHDIKVCEDWSFSKDNMLKIATCPHCEEPLMFSHIKQAIV